MTSGNRCRATSGGLCRATSGNRCRVALCAATVWAVLIASTQAALACPACAGREGGGVMRGVLLGMFIFFPFAVVAVVVRFIRSAGDDTAKTKAAP